MNENPFNKHSNNESGLLSPKYVSKKESFLINDSKVDTIDVIPENQKDDVPVLICPGHSATKETVEPGSEVLAQKGRRAISFSHPRTGGIIPDSHNGDIEQWYKDRGKKYPEWPKEELRKANTILELLTQKKIDKADLILYSEAAINGCIAAMLNPEKFIGRTIVLYSPAGLIGDDSLLRLAKGVMTHPERPDSISDIPITENEKKNLKLSSDTSKDYKKANRLRYLKEGLAIPKVRIEEMLRYLHEKGVRIIVVQGVDDTFFPMDKMQKIVKSKNVTGGFVDGFVSVDGGHVQIQVHPELYMSAIESMLGKTKEKQ